MKESKETSMYRNNPRVIRKFIMKYTKKERLDIGRQIYEGELSRYQVAEIYGISDQTAREY